MMRVLIEKGNLDKLAEVAGQSLLLRLAHRVLTIARRLTSPASGPSSPGSPPHQHYGDLDRSIAVAVDDATGDVLIGPRASIVGQRGAVLEFAGTHDPDTGRDEFGHFLTGQASRTAPSGARRAHPFMRPAFERAIATETFEGGNTVSFN